MQRSTREVWAKRVERWKDSGLSAKEFAREVGLKASTLSYWRWKLGVAAKKRGAVKKSATTTPVVTRRATKKQAALSTRPLSFVEVTRASSSVFEPFEVDLANGDRVRIPPSFDPEALRRLLAVLEGR